MDKNTLLRKIGRELAYSVNRFPAETGRKVVLGENERALLGNCKAVRFRGYQYPIVAIDMESYIGLAY